MAITEHPTDIDDDAIVIAESWLEARAKLECVCPEPCLIDHDN